MKSLIVFLLMISVSICFAQYHTIAKMGTAPTTKDTIQTQGSVAKYISIFNLTTTTADSMFVTTEDDTLYGKVYLRPGAGYVWRDCVARWVRIWSVTGSAVYKFTANVGYPRIAR
jgi:hypothetical protein